MSKKALIFGAGAIGRGFLAHLLLNSNFVIDFVEKDKNLIKKLKGKNKYITAIAKTSGYHFNEIKYNHIFFLDDDYDTSEYDAVFLCVGPNNCLELTNKLRGAQNIFILENDWNIKRKLIESTGNSRIFFTIPDVITSNTAPDKLLLQDPLCVVSEEGSLIVENGDYDISFAKSIRVVEPDELACEWICKFYIHNAVHAVTAYLGALKNYTYIHEAMEDEKIANLTEEAIGTITEAIIKLKLVSETKAVSYMKRELDRFKDQLLFDPIARVARDPFRKLHRNGRLIKALLIINKVGGHSYPFLLGINAALRYRGKTSDDIRFAEYADKTSRPGILRNLCGLEDEKMIGQIIESDLSYFLDRKK
jgi:mannitol-1-phosphate 5-dehydrogenase